MDIKKILSFYNVSPVTVNTLLKMNLHQNVNLSYVIDEITKKGIDLKTIPLGVLSQVTFTEHAIFNTFTIDDIFFILIGLLNLIIILCRNNKVFDDTKYKFSNKTKQLLKSISQNLNTFLGFIFIIYGFYMIKMLLFEKQFILVSRYVYVYTYLFAGFAIISMFIKNTILPKFI